MTFSLFVGAGLVRPDRNGRSRAEVVESALRSPTR